LCVNRPDFYVIKHFPAFFCIFFYKKFAHVKKKQYLCGLKHE